jgi:hypothetical protein
MLEQEPAVHQVIGTGFGRVVDVRRTELDVGDAALKRS